MHTPYGQAMLHRQKNSRKSTSASDILHRGTHSQYRTCSWNINIPSHKTDTQVDT